MPPVWFNVKFSSQRCCQPGVAISFLVGNLYYAWLAVRLARREGRTDVCALPYGISTPGLIAHVFLVMLPAKQLAPTTQRRKGTP